MNAMRCHEESLGSKTQQGTGFAESQWLALSWLHLARVKTQALSTTFWAEPCMPLWCIARPQAQLLVVYNEASSSRATQCGGHTQQLDGSM